MDNALDFPRVDTGSSGYPMPDQVDAGSDGDGTRERAHMFTGKESRIERLERQMREQARLSSALLAQLERLRRDVRQVERRRAPGERANGRADRARDRR